MGMGAAVGIASPPVRPKKRARGETWKPEELPSQLPDGFARETNRFLDYSWRDERASIEFRILSWLKRNSWGFNFREAIVPLKREEGGERAYRYRPAAQTDLAKALKLHASH